MPELELSAGVVDYDDSVCNVSDMFGGLSYEQESQTVPMSAPERTTAARDARHLTAVGVITNADASGAALYATFDGLPVAATDVLVKYTLYGDLNLDGIIGGSYCARDGIADPSGISRDIVTMSARHGRLRDHASLPMLGQQPGAIAVSQ